MVKVYPFVEDKVEIVKLDASVVAEKIIVQRELGLTKAQMLGIVLSGSDDVVTFNDVWDKIEAERIAFSKVVVCDSEAKHKIELNKLREYLDVDVWVAQLKGKKTWVELKVVEE